jgi:hypothetical protein
MAPSWRTALRRMRASIALLAGVASPLAAQQLRGTVLLPDSSSRAPGVIVELLTPGGALVERTLTNPRGEFTLTAKGPGDYSARALRVGFRPTIVPAVALASPGSVATVTIVLNALPISLDAIAVIANEQCRLRPDSGQMVYRVWNEASKALLSSRLSATGAPLIAEWITYSRLTDPADRRVAEQRVRTTRSATLSVFASWDAESLAVNGYVVARGDSSTYYAPDARVLLSDAFAAGHCLRLQRASADSSALIGVHFEPATRRENFNDITGTFWVDRASAELRSLDFAYTGLPKIANEARPGGHVEFTHLSSGNWVINRWFLRLPEVGTQLSDQHTGNFRTTSNTPVLRGVHVAGGEVVTMTREGVELFRGVFASMQLTVTSADPRHPASSATVLLEGTDYEAHADSTGHVVIPQVLPGTYRAQVQTPTMMLAQVPLTARDVAVGPAARALARLGTRTDSIALPTLPELFRSACKGDEAGPDDAMLIGFVRDSAGVGRADVAVSASWLDVRNMSEGALSTSADGVAIRTGDVGQYRLCGVPRRVRVTLRSESDSLRGAQTFVIADSERVRAADVELRTARLDSPDALPSLLEFVVTAPGNVPVADVTLDVAIGNFSRRVRTSAKGLALIANVPPGLVSIRTRRVGFQQGDLAILARPGRNTVPIHLNATLPPQLDTVRVMGSRVVSARLDEFETRRLRHETTASITREEIEKRNPVDTWQMLTNVPSVTIAERMGVVVAQSSRGRNPSLMGPMAPCPYNVMVDGVAMQSIVGPDGMPHVDLKLLPDPKDVHGIEVFGGPAQIPLQYGGTGNGKWCGLIAIWTRDGR